MASSELISWSLKGDMKKYEETLRDEDPLNSTQSHREENRVSWNLELKAIIKMS